MTKASLVKKTIFILIIVVVNIFADQASKKIARNQIHPYQRIEVIENVFTLMNVENTGAMLGLCSDCQPILKKALLIGFPVIAIFGLLLYTIFNTQFDKLTTIALSMIIGGGIGNLYDRFLYGSVTDFLFIDFQIFKTGIFNIADLSVTTGVFMIIIAAIFSKKK